MWMLWHSFEDLHWFKDLPTRWLPYKWQNHYCFFRFRHWIRCPSGRFLWGWNKKSKTQVMMPRMNVSRFQKKGHHSSLLLRLCAYELRWLLSSLPLVHALSVIRLLICLYSMMNKPTKSASSPKRITVNNFTFSSCVCQAPSLHSTDGLNCEWLKSLQGLFRPKSTAYLFPERTMVTTLGHHPDSRRASTFSINPKALEPKGGGEGRILE